MSRGLRQRQRRQRLEAAPLRLRRFALADWPGCTPDRAAGAWISEREGWHRLHADERGISGLGDLVDLLRARREVWLLAVRRGA